MSEWNYMSLKTLQKLEVTWSVPVSGGINISNLYSTGNLWSWMVDSRVHELDGFPHGVMVLLLWRERTESTSILLERFWGRESLAGFHHFYVALEKWSGQNRINHPHWVKICDDHNGQINLRAKQKYEVLFAILSFQLKLVKANLCLANFWDFF